MAIDRKVGRYLEGSQGLEDRLNRTIANHSKADLAIKNRQARIDRENELSIAADAVRSQYQSKPTPKSIDRQIKQHEEFAAKIGGIAKPQPAPAQPSLRAQADAHRAATTNPARKTLAKNLRDARANIQSPKEITAFASEKQKAYAETVRAKTVAKMSGWGGYRKRDRRILNTLAKGLAARQTSADVILGETFEQRIMTAIHDAKEPLLKQRKAR